MIEREVSLKNCVPRAGSSGSVPSGSRLYQRASNRFAGLAGAPRPRVGVSGSDIGRPLLGALLPPAVSSPATAKEDAANIRPSPPGRLWTIQRLPPAAAPAVSPHHAPDTRRPNVTRPWP